MTKAGRLALALLSKKLLFLYTRLFLLYIACKVHSHFCANLSTKVVLMVMSFCNTNKLAPIRQFHLVAACITAVKGRGLPYSSELDDT